MHQLCIAKATHRLHVLEERANWNGNIEHTVPRNLTNVENDSKLKNNQHSHTLKTSKCQDKLQ